MGSLLSRVAGYDESPHSLDIPVQVNLVGENARVPVFSSDLSAGSDLYASEDAELHPGVPTKVETGVCLALPGYLYGTIAGRSSYNAKGILTAPGVIDSDYRGTLKVLMTNNSTRDSRDPIRIKAGDRIAQLVIMPVIRPEYMITADELPSTTRGDGGSGSTGNGQIRVAEPVVEAEPEGGANRSLEPYRTARFCTLSNTHTPSPGIGGARLAAR